MWLELRGRRRTYEVRIWGESEGWFKSFRYWWAGAGSLGPSEEEEGSVGVCQFVFWSQEVIRGYCMATGTGMLVGFTEGGKFFGNLQIDSVETLAGPRK